MPIVTPSKPVAMAAVFVFIATANAGAQAERRTLSGDRVAIYNLAGKVRVQAGSGSQVVVDVTRGGRDGGQLKLASGDVRGWESLRVIYPSDRIIYPEMGYRSRTQMTVNSDGTFDDGNHDRGFFSRDRVEISDSGSGLDAHADLVVSVPRGQRIAIHWGVGDANVSNVDGDLLLSVGSATVTAEHTRGRLNLDTGSGSVSLTDAQGAPLAADGVLYVTGPNQVYALDALTGEALWNYSRPAGLGREFSFRPGSLPLRQGGERLGPTGLDESGSP
jgi:hypothetical protein